MTPSLRKSSTTSSFNSSSSSLHSKNDDDHDHDRGDFVLPESGIVFSQKEKDEYVEIAYKIGQTHLVNMLIDVLLENQSSQKSSWISSALLFTSTTLPQSLLPVWKFSTNIWKKHDTSSIVVIDDDTEVHFLGKTTAPSKLLVRHKFSDGWYYYRACVVDDGVVDDPSSLRDLVLKMINEHVTAGKRPRLDNQTKEYLTSTMKERLPTTLKMITDSLSLQVGIVPKAYKIRWSQELVSYYDSPTNGYYRYDHTIDDDDDDQPRWKTEIAAYERKVLSSEKGNKNNIIIDAPWKANGFDGTKKSYRRQTCF
jgi:hypothetical protein